MYILLVYIAGLAVLSLVTKKWSQRIKSMVTVGYNYLFVIPLYYFAQLDKVHTFWDGLRLFLDCAYAAPKALTFGGRVELFEDPAVIALFYVMSLYTIRAVMIIFFRRMLTVLVMNWRMFRKKEIYVVCGTEEDAKVLVKDIHSHIRHAAVVYMPPRTMVKDPDIPDALVRERSFQETLRPGKRYSIVLLPEEGNNNIIKLQELNRLGERLPGLRVTAFLDNDLLRFENMSYPNLDAYLVSREQLLTRGFMAENLPLSCLKKREGAGTGFYRPRERFSLGIIGFGAISREFLLTTYENTAFETAEDKEGGLEAFILDGNLSAKKAAFLQDVPYFAEEKNIQWLETEPDSQDCFDAVEQRLPHLHQLLIATQDTRYNVELAMRLLRLFHRNGMEKDHPQLVVVLYETDAGSVEFLSKEAGGAFLQSNSSQFTYQELIQREIDRKAEALHQQYVASSFQGSAWNQIGTFQQNSNRAVVWDIPNKLLLAGDTQGLTKEQKEALMWRLARYEHSRWNAFQYTHGWTRLPQEELTEEEKKAFRLKRTAQKRHACLVGWEELDQLPQKRPGLLKYYDYENVLPLFQGDINQE